jgi:single-strand DNA-binding protein
MNNLNAIGNIGVDDAVLKYTAKGDPICNFSFALTSGYGEKQVTTWINCALFGKRGETLAPMLLKGTKIGIEGQLTNRPYVAKDGSKKLSLELRVNDVTLLGSKSDSPVQKPANVAIEDIDQDIPF